MLWLHRWSQNSKMEHFIICNKGAKFSNGTLYLSFNNPSEDDMIIDLKLYHHHQLRFEAPNKEIKIPAGEKKQVEIQFRSQKNSIMNKIDLIRTDWEIKYNDPTYEKIILQGKSQFEVQAQKEK